MENTCGKIDRMTPEKLKELVDYMESNKVEEKTVCLRFKEGDIIFVPASLRQKFEIKPPQYIPLDLI